MAGSSLIYSNGALYRMIMRLLYGRYYVARSMAIADEISEHSSVTEACAGDGTLYTDYLKNKSVTYTGLELSEALVSRGTKQGAKVRVFDLWTDDLPVSDFVVMQSSLYQFIPEEKRIVDKLLAAAREKLIISEPIRNLSSSSNPLIAGISRLLTKPGSQSSYAGKRFDEQSLSALFNDIPEFERSFPIPGGREIVGIFEGRAPS